jgi:phosphatidylglycerophosphate synthase
MSVANPSPQPVQSIPKSALTAVVILVPGTSELNVAALTVFDRLLVALHRAGYRDIVVVGREPVPAAPRARVWGVPFSVVHQVPPIEAPTLIVRAEVLVQVADLKRLANGRNRLVGAKGEAFPLGVVVDSAGDWERSMAANVPVRAEGVACWVRNEAEAKQAARVLWGSLTSSSDGWVDRVFNRPVGRPLARWLSRTWVTPNQISVASILLGVIAGVLFGVGHREWAIAAGLLFQLSAVLDCVDGDVARIVFKESPLGKWLDLIGDQVVHVSVFAGIAVGLARSGSAAPVGWLGLAAIVGALLSFLLVLRGMRRPSGEDGNRLLGRFLDAATNRDFSVLVFALACVDRLEVFLWLAAIGSHVFWALLGWLQWREASDRRGAA